MSTNKLTLLILLVLTSVSLLIRVSTSNQEVPLPLPTSLTVESTLTPRASTPAIPLATPTPSLPTSVLLPVPFTPQAPTANWDELHNEACEEASIIMAAAYFAGDTRSVIPPSEVEAQLTTLTEWQQKHFGYYLDSNAEETARMIREVYGLKARLIRNFSESDIKHALANDELVIAMLAGRKLDNPYYRAPGPEYHVIIFRGYTSTHLISNDPGTRRGAGYKYTFATIDNATAEWDHAIEGIDESKSVIVVVSR